MRERHYVEYILDSEAPEEAEKHYEQDCFKNLGYEYAKKYAVKRPTCYKYWDSITNVYFTFDKKLNNPRQLHYVGKIYTWILE
jgi:hypothetical protein